MEEIFNKLYSNEYFSYYLIGAIVLLVILFIIILFLGRKDQKEREIEATRKLEQINEDAFKEEDNEVALEIEKQKMDDTIIMPTIEDVPDISLDNTTNSLEEPLVNIDVPQTNMEQSDNLEAEKMTFESLNVNEEMPAADINLNENIPVMEEVKSEDITFPSVDLNMEVKPSVNEDSVMPTLDKIEEKPFVFTDEEPLNLEAPIVEEPPLMEVPTFSFDEVKESISEEPIINKGPEIFSSVYIKEEEKEDVKKDLGFELPALKKEAKKEDAPAIQEYSFDNIMGEEYNIKK